MTRIPVHTVDSTPEGSRDALKSLDAKFGKVLNIHGAMAHSPAVLETYVAIQAAPQDKGTLDKRLREVVALAVANVDQCSYCQAAHTAGGNELTETSAVVALNLFTNYFNHLVQTDLDLWPRPPCDVSPHDRLIEI
jgi:AhpD family alkylhydroperoxidase